MGSVTGSNSNCLGWAGGGGVCSDSGREGRELRNWRREEVDLVHSQVWDEKERKC